MRRHTLATRIATIGFTFFALPGCSSSGDSANPDALGGTDGGGATTGESGGSAGSAQSGNGGSAGNAGANGTGGRPGSGGNVSSGGGTGNGGSSSDGGASGNGGSSGDGGATGNGGSSGDGGASGNGGTTGSGGANGTGGSSGTKACKRGIATNTAPGAAFHPKVGWWYNWAPKSSGTDVGVEFVPMIWGTKDLSANLPSGSKFLLTFNEPNFKAQSNLTPQQAASHWPEIEAKAAALGIPIVSPAMNYCGPAANCNGTSPYQYLKDFFAACDNCKVDYVAVHWYNCDLPSLKDYLEPGGGLEGFEQFGKPIWLTEFSCNGSASVSENETYMKAAIPYLEGKANVFRYSWFSAGPIPNARLTNADGTPTDLGKVYISLDGDCQ